MSAVLGVSCHYHDAAAALLRDGVLVAAAQEERFSRRKGDAGCAIHLDAELRFPHSVGLLYSAFTQFLGFEVNEGEYKVMGLAAYGEPRFRGALDRVVRVHDDGSIELALEYFDFLTSLEQMFSPRLVELLGVEPHAPE